jgi:hypothetical protein
MHVYIVVACRCVVGPSFTPFCVVAHRWPTVRGDCQGLTTLTVPLGIQLCHPIFFVFVNSYPRHALKVV